MGSCSFEKVSSQDPPHIVAPKGLPLQVAALYQAVQRVAGIWDVLPSVAIVEKLKNMSKDHIMSCRHPNVSVLPRHSPP